MELADPLDLPVVLRQVGLDGQVPLRRQPPQKRHQPVGAGGGEPGRQHGLHKAEVPARLQPAEGRPFGILRGLLQHAGGGVPVHVHLAHVSGDAGLLQLLHQDQRGVRVEGGEHAHPGGAVFDELPGEAPVDGPGVVRVGEPGLRGEGIGIQPVQQGQVHAGAQHGVLGAVEVQVREGLEHQVVPPVLHRGAGVSLRQGGEDALNDAVFSHKVPVRRGVQPPQGGGGDDGPLDDGQHDGRPPLLVLRFRRWKRAPAGDVIPPADTHRRASGGSVETFAP